MKKRKENDFFFFLVQITFPALEAHLEWNQSLTEVEVPPIEAGTYL